MFEGIDKAVAAYCKAPERLRVALLAAMVFRNVACLEAGHAGDR